MVMPTDLKMFEVKCPSCGWEDTVAVRTKLGTLFPILDLPLVGTISKKYLKSQLPSECPKCSAKVTSTELPVRF